MNKEKIVALDKIYKESLDSHNIYTPLELCEEMINSLTDLNGDILVISNLEFLIILKSKISLDRVHYTTSCEIKKQVAISLGLKANNIYDLEYNNKEINLNIPVKFDVVIQNPPYNPNSLWKKFIEKGIDLLNDNGQMVSIHPDSWRISSKHKKLFNHLKEHISELHIEGYNVFDNAEISVDWYLYNKNIINETKIIYPDKTDILKIENEISLVSINSIESSIKNKICTKENNGLIIKNTGFGDIYNNYIFNGKFKQCGGAGRGNSWTKKDYHLTNDHTKHQFDDKVVMTYCGKPRATYFNSNDKIGVLRGFYWLTNNKSLSILLNSKMLWKILLIFSGEKYKYKGLQNPSIKILRTLNFDGLNVQTEEELYEHYGLTIQEIEWIEDQDYWNIIKEEIDNQINLIEHFYSGDKDTIKDAITDILYLNNINKDYYDLTPTEYQKYIKLYNNEINDRYNELVKCGKNEINELQQIKKELN